MGNGDVDTDGGRGGGGGGEEIDGDVEWAKAWMVRKALRGFALDIVFSADKICKRSEEL
jgi:hypothetical protein